VARTLAAAPPAEVVAARVVALRHRIEDAGRDPADVRIVAVTKGFTAGAIDAARAAGLYDIGENYADEFLAKRADVSSAGGGPPDAPEAPPPTRWHYLGAIQRRRVRMLAPVVSWWQTVSRVSEGEAIASRAPGATVLVEVETTGIPGRNGCAPSEVPALVTTLRAAGLDVRGLMTVGPPGPPDESRRSFRVTAELARALGLPEVSMGMTDDLEAALSEGSTMLRVGRALFGERPLGPM
jgi:hypothetical protein